MSSEEEEEVDEFLLYGDGFDNSHSDEEEIECLSCVEYCCDSTTCAALCVLCLLCILLVFFTGVLYLTVAEITSGSYRIYPLDKATVIEKTHGLLYSANCWKFEGTQNCAPSFIIAGTMKGGTTSLYQYLLHHPLILPLNQSQVILPRAEDGTKMQITAMGNKETRFFHKTIYNPLLQHYTKSQAIQAYLDLFPSISRKQALEGYITGEASPTYMVTNKI